MTNDKKSEKPKEQEAVFTTIVGGRPPGSGTQVGNIPRGIEVLVKKASVDYEFRELLLEKRAEAAIEIDLELDKTEADMLAAIPREQLEKIIENTKIPTNQKPVFMSKFSKLMLTVIITGTVILIPSSCTAGISPDEIKKTQMDNSMILNDSNDPDDPNSGKLQQTPINQENPLSTVSRGISPVRD